VTISSELGGGVLRGGRVQTPCGVSPYHQLGFARPQEHILLEELVLRSWGREKTGSPLRTQTLYKRTLGEEPAGPRLYAGLVFDRCIQAAGWYKYAMRAMGGTAFRC
jgi:hypothetical protein